MTWSWRRALWPLLGVAIVAVAVLMRDPLSGQNRVSPALGAGVAAMSLAALASFLAYRVTADPRLLFVGVGAAGVAINLLLFDLARPPGYGLFRDPFGSHTVGASVVAMLVAWLLYGIAMVFAVPWWERRGRPALNPVLVVGTGLGALAIVDVIVYAFPPTIEGSGELGRWFPDPGWFDLVLAWAVLGVLVVASMRLMVDHASGEASGWLSTATAVAIGGPASWLLLQFDSEGPYEAAQALYLVVPAVVGTIVLVASLVSIRSTMTDMRRATDQAERIVEGRAEIAGMIAHEVRGPVTTIRGIASTATGHYERLDDAERKEFFELIEQESRRLLGAVDQTSLALKVDAGSLSYTMGPTDLAATVRAGVGAAGIENHPVHVVAEEGVILLGDPLRITELVRQLADNAAKFSPEGEPVTVRAVADGGTALIEIDDRGPGIPPEQRDVVFGRFARWRPKGYEERPGNGLGLFICRGIAAEHLGEITVEDRPTGGTMLRVRLPLGGT